MAPELRLLRYFAVVAEERHVRHAAARLYISQPALSQQIRVLEEQVGLPLFTRHPKGVELTEAGEALLAEARAVLDRSDRFEEAIDDLRRGQTTRLRIALPPGLAPDVVPSLLAPLRERRPEARIDVSEMTTPDQLPELRAGALDLGIVREPIDDERLSRRTILIEPLGASLPATHPLAGRDDLRLEELADDQFICFPRPWAPALHDVVAEELRARDLRTRFQESEHVSTTTAMVAAGHGVTLSTPAWIGDVPGIVWRPFADVDIEIRTAAAWRPDNRSPVLKELLELLPVVRETRPR